MYATEVGERGRGREGDAKEPKFMLVENGHFECHNCEPLNCAEGKG